MEWIFEIIGIAKFWKSRFRNTNADIGIAPQDLAIPHFLPCLRGPSHILLEITIENRKNRENQVVPKKAIMIK